MTKGEIKNIFKQHHVQLGADALVMIEDHLKREVTLMAQRCKEGNYKRLTVEHFWVALGNWGDFSSKR